MLITPSGKPDEPGGQSVADATSRTAPRSGVVPQCLWLGLTRLAMVECLRKVLDKLLPLQPRVHHFLKHVFRHELAYKQFGENGVAGVPRHQTMTDVIKM
ncbi:hypothetical protein DL765_002584 [Monosporascus sp. GIB2]|nr:hypothetical protein DL765_002584 [Monosporascus sp. GIB2]